jgi:methylmalonyl-CoA/ethylmalonyl-CoA epimerase
MLALDFNGAVLDRATAAALALELTCQRRKPGVAQWQAGDQRHRLAGTTLGLAANPHLTGIRARRATRGGLAGAVRLRAATARTDPAHAGAVDNAHESLLWSGHDSLATFHGTNLFRTQRQRMPTSAVRQFSPAQELSGYAVPIELKFHHGGISVPDLEASIRWYHDTLGFEVEQRFEIPKAHARVAMIRRGPLRMELFEVEDAKPLPEDRRLPDRDLKTHGNKHVCFGIKSVREAEQELRAKGVDIVFVGGLKGMPPNIFLRDNSGNLIEFIEQPDLW